MVTAATSSAQAPLGPARQEKVQSSISRPLPSTSQMQDGNEAKTSLKEAIARDEHNVNGKRASREQPPAGDAGHSTDIVAPRAMRPPPVPLVQRQSEAVDNAVAQRNARVLSEAAASLASGHIGAKEDSIEVARRRSGKPRRSRASGGNHVVSGENRRTVGIEKGPYGNKAANRASRNDQRHYPELPYLSPEQKSVYQIINELQSTYLLNEALSRLVQSPQAPLPDANWTNNVYVNNLPPQTTDEDLYRIGRSYGKVKSHKAIINPNTGLCKGYGFVMYETLEEAELALQRLPLHGLTASWAKESFTAKLRRMADLTTANVYLSNLPLDYTPAQLEELFSPHHIVSMRLLTDPETRKPKGVGFVRLENREIAQQCIDNLHGRILPGQTTAIQVRFADSDAQKQLKQSVRAAGGSVNGDGDVFKSAGLEPPFFNAYLHSPLLPAWSGMGAMGADQGHVLRSPTGNKENVAPNGSPHAGVAYAHPHAHGNQHSFGIPPHQLLAQNLMQHNLAVNGYLPPPALAASNGMFAPQQPLAFSPMLHQPALPQTASNSQHAAKVTSLLQGQPQPSHAVKIQRSMREILDAAPTLLTEKAVKINDAAAFKNAQKHTQSSALYGGAPNFEVPAAQAAHPLSSTPLRTAMPIPPVDDKKSVHTAIGEAQVSEALPRVSPSVSSTSSLAPTHSLPIRAQSALDYYSKPGGVDSFVQGTGTQETAKTKNPKPSSITHSSADESYKTGKEQAASPDGVRAGANGSAHVEQAPASLNEDVSTSLSKTDSGKDVDQRSVTDAETSIFEKDSPASGTNGHRAERKGHDAKALAVKIGEGRTEDAVPLSPIEPMPLSEPATIVPDKL